MSELVTTRDDGALAIVTLNRPDKLNALNLALIEDLVAAGEALARRRDIRAVVLTGAGKAFSAGLDVAAMPDLARVIAARGGIMARSHGRSNLFQAAAMVWSDLPQPVIAAIPGYAFGGGFQIMLGADIRIAAPDAEFSVMEAKWGLVPDMGGMVLMPRLARADVIRRLTFSGERFAAAQALDWGFVTELAEDPLARAMELAGVIADRSPDAMRAAKRLITQALTGDPAEVLLAESAAQEGLIGSPNQLEAVMAGLERRKPDFDD